MENKRGELTSSYIGAIIISVVGFLILLAALALFNFGEYNQQQVCQLSVLTRATTPSAIQNYVPLRCTTEKICIVEKNSDECTEFLGEKEVDKIILTGDNAKDSLIIAKTNADSMFECWGMMGQGKLDLFSGGYMQSIGLKQGQSTCVVCSRIALAPSVKAKKAVLENVDINNYLQTQSPNNGAATYSQLFKNDYGTQTFSKLDLTKPGSVIDSSKLKEGESDGKYDLRKVDVEIDQTNTEITYIFMQIKVDSVTDTLKNLGSSAGVALAGSFAISPVTTLRTAGTIVSSAPAAIVAVVGSLAVVGFSAYNADKSQVAAAGYCGEFKSSDTNSKGAVGGCSIVEGMPYDFRTVNKLCSSIQGNP